MRKLLLLFTALLVASVFNLQAQIVYDCSSWPIYESTTGLTITFHANLQSNANLKGQSELYAHIGVITNYSTDDDDWKHEGTWPDINGYNGKYKMTRVAGTNDYVLSLGSGTIREYFNMTDANETIQKIAIIPHNTAGTEQAATQYFEVRTPAESFDASPQANYPGGVPREGAVKSGSDVIFCFAAPQKSGVTLFGSWDNFASGQLMNYQDYQGVRYFWTTVSSLSDTQWYTYYFRVEGTYNVCDPFSPMILDPEYDSQITSWSGFPTYPTAVSSVRPFPASEKTLRTTSTYTPSDHIRLSCYKGDFHDTYTWQTTSFTPADLSTITIYELFFRDFTGTNNQANGEGTIRAAIAKIPYLKDLGITCVELMPVMEFDRNKNWGYDTNQHFAVDKQYGSADDLKEFIDLCHANGIAVVLDIVFNHLTNASTWYEMYYPGESPFFNVNAPHNWSVHNDIRQDFSYIEPYYYKVLDYWMDNYRVDGFRFDLVKGLGNNDSYAASYDGNADNPSIVSRMARIHAHMKAKNPNVIHINEFFGTQHDEKEMGNDGQLVWLHWSLDGAQNYVKGTDGNVNQCSFTETGYPQWGIVNYIESHDEPWLSYLAQSSDNATVAGHTDVICKRRAAASVQQLIAHGPQMIWQMGEVGYDEYLEPGSDTSGNRVFKPKKVHWEYLDDPDRAAIHSTFRAMINLRNKNADLFAPDIKPNYTGFNASNSNARSIRLTAGDKEVIVLLNPNSITSATVTASTTKVNSGNYYVVTASKDFTPAVNGSGSSISVSVPANGYCVLASNAVVRPDSSGDPDPEPDPEPNPDPDPEPAHDDYYLVGTTINNGGECWVDNENFKFTYVSADTYTIQVPSLSGKIKIKKAGTWDQALASNKQKLQLNVEYTAWNGNNDGDIEIDGTITNALITVHPSVRKILVTQYTTEPDPDPDPVIWDGDVNHDGEIDIQDVYDLLQLIHSGAN